MNTENPAILIVDSDSESRLFVKEALLERGFVVHEAETSEQSFQILSTHKISVAVIDLELSDQDRKTFVSRVQSEEFGKVGVFLLISTSEMTREEAYDLGVVAALSKPIDTMTLISRVEAYLLPAGVKWRKTLAKHPRHQIAVSLNHLKLGRGGFTLQNEPNHQIYEGEAIEFNVEVNDLRPWRLKGTGIVRYVQLDQKNRRQKAWGIEFESLDESSLENVVHSIERGKPISYIPRSVS